MLFDTAFRLYQAQLESIFEEIETGHLINSGHFQNRIDLIRLYKETIKEISKDFDSELEYLEKEIKEIKEKEETN